LTRLRTQVLLFTLTRTVLNTVHRMVYPFLPAFGRGLGVDLAALSLALTLRSLAGALTPLFGSIADSRGRKTGMLTGLLLFTAGAGLVALRPSYLTFLLALTLAVWGKYLFDPSMQAYLGDRVSYQRRGLVIAISEVGWSLSFIAGVPLVGLLIARRGWTAPFPLLALLGLLALVVLARILPGDPAPEAARPGLRENLALVLRHTPALAALVMGLLMSAANEVVNLVFGVWMEDSFGLKIAALGAASAVIGFAELGGESLVGGLTDRLGKPRALAGGLLLNCAAALVLPLLGRSLPGALAGLFLFYLTFEFTLVSSIPLMTEILPSARATLMAANIAGLSLGRALGASLGSLLYGLGALAPALPGILPGALAAVLLNFMALVALKRIKMSEEGIRETESGDR
jgi:predicted MFS family arabinose efflux permease